MKNINKTENNEAMEFLRNEGKFKNVPRPDLILLDLNMPRKSGLEVLSEIKGDDDLTKIPVVILTVSKNEEDIIKSYNSHANCYITKPVDLDHAIQKNERDGKKIKSSYKETDLVRFGYCSRNERKGSPQVNLILGVNNQHAPLFENTYPGNTSPCAKS